MSETFSIWSTSSGRGLKTVFHAISGRHLKSFDYSIKPFHLVLTTKNIVNNLYRVIMNLKVEDSWELLMKIMEICEDLLHSTTSHYPIFFFFKYQKRYGKFNIM